MTFGRCAAICVVSVFCLALNVRQAAAATPETVCDFLIHHPVTKSRAGDFVFPPGTVNVQDEPRHDLDLDGDGIADEIATGFGGTSNSDAYDIKLSSLNGERYVSATHDPAQAIPKQLSALGYDQGGLGIGEIWLKFGRHYYDVNYSDNSDYAEIEHVEYLLPNGKLRYACIFKNDVRESDWKYAAVSSGFRGDARAVCPPRGTPFQQPPFLPATGRISKEDADLIPREELRKTQFAPFCENGEADCKDIWQVDFDNDGKIERLVKLAAYSGAGRGCDLEKFVLLDVRDKPVGGAKQAVLEKMRGPCESRLNWAKVAGRTVLLRQPPQDIVIAQGMDAALLCSSVSKMIPKIAYVDPQLKK